MSSVASGILMWLGAYALHSTIFLGALWLFDRFAKGASPALVGSLWRTALIAGVLTASLQASGLVQPIAGLVQLPAEAIAASEPAVLPGSAPVDLSVDTSESALPAAATSVSMPESVIVSAPVFDLGQIDWAIALAAAWAVVVSGLVLRAAIAWWLAHRELADRAPVVQGPLFERIQALAQQVGLRRLPQVSFSSRIAGPFTLPNGEICVPVWAREKLPQNQLDAMLAHEMAHVLHRDSFWLAIGMAISAVFFFQPLNFIARRRMAHLAELSADDWAATQAGGGLALAECISTFVGFAHDKARSRAAPEFAAAMAKPNSPLVQRVERLVSGRYSNGALPMKTKLLVGACVIALAACMPGLVARADHPPAPPAAPAAPEAAATPEAPQQVTAPTPPVPPVPDADASQHSVRITNGGLFGGKTLRIIETNLNSRLEATGEGEIKLAPDGTGVLEMSNGGFLDVTLDKNFGKRRVRYSKANGAIQREFWSGGQTKAWGPEADQFVAEIMPLMFQNGGFNVADRVDWLLKARGQDAFLAEVGGVDSDTVTSRYIGRYNDTTKIAEPYYSRLLSTIRDRIDSDTVTGATLAAIYEKQAPAGRQLVQLIKAGDRIDSDTVTGAFLGKVGTTALTSDDGVAAYIDLSRNIDSDTVLGATLSSALRTASLSEARVVKIMDLAAREIDSDTVLGNVLGQIVERVGASDQLAKAYTDASRSIDSDTVNGATLKTLAERAQLTPAGWRMMLDASLRIESDTVLSGLLSSVAGRAPRQADVSAAYDKAVQSIESDTVRRRAVEART